MDRTPPEIIINGIQLCRNFLTFCERIYKKKAQSVSSGEGYFIPSLITTTSFVAGMNSIVVNKGQTMPLNMFSVIVGPSTTANLRP